MKTISSIVVSSLLIAAAAQSEAGTVTGLTRFDPGTTAVSSQVNGNFSTVATAVNDNDSRIGVLESSPSITGNLVLPDSTDASTGNIFKGSSSFLSDYGTADTFLGLAAGNYSTTGNQNTGLGFNALNAIQNGFGNVAVGSYALTANTSGQGNSAVGHAALNADTSGGGNSAFGIGALNKLTNADNNTAIGASAMPNNLTSANNTAIGAQAFYLGTGSDNITLGFQAGYNLVTGDHNIDIGNQGVAGENDTIRIGDQSQHTRAFIAGICCTTTASASGDAVVVDFNGQLGTVLSSRRYKDHIHAMGPASNVLNRLHPVTFYYKTDHDPKGRHLQYGLVAEDVARIAPMLVSYDKQGRPNSVHYRFLAPMLLNQYLKQQRTIAAQSALLKKQAQEIAELKKQSARVTALEKQMARINTILAMRRSSQRLASADIGMH